MKTNITTTGRAAALLTLMLSAHAARGAWTFDDTVSPPVITSGAWTLNVEVSGDSLTVTGVNGENYDPNGFLDLAAGVSGGKVIAGIGNNAFYNKQWLRHVTLPGTLGVIGNSAFDYCQSLTNVVPLLPSSVVSIGEAAFSWCTSLEGELSLVNGNLKTVPYAAFQRTKIRAAKMAGSGIETIGVRAFTNDGDTAQSLGHVTLPGTLETIGNSAFEGCLGLTNVVPLLPPSVVSIGESAFGMCVSLEGELSLVNGNLKTVPYAAFHRTSIRAAHMAESGIETIGVRAFSQNENYPAAHSLGRVTLPGTLETIGNYAFDSCMGLTNVVPLLPPSVEFIGDGAFGLCLNLEGELSLVNGNLKTVPGGAFSRTKISAALMAESGITTIGWKAFGHDEWAVGYSLGRVTLPDTLESIDALAFFLCAGLTNVVPLLPPSVEFIGNGAFESCTSLEGELSLVNGNLKRVSNAAFAFTRISAAHMAESGIETIGELAFGANAWNDHRHLRAVTLPDTLEAIENRAFANCIGLTNVVPLLPPRVVSVGNRAFEFCTSLEGALSLMGDDPSLGESAFEWTKLDSITFGEKVFDLSAPGIFHNNTAVEKVWFHGESPVFSSSVFSGWGNAQAILYIPRNDPTWNAFTTSGFETLDDPMKADFQTAFPGEPFPRGLIFAPGADSGNKQYLAFWSPPSAARKRTLIIIR